MEGENEKLPPLKYVEIRKSGDVPDDPTKMAPPLDPKRRFCVTASTLDEFIDRSYYGDYKSALPKILGLETWDGNDASRLGKRMEWHIADYFVRIYKDEINPNVEQIQPEFKRHPTLRFAGASNDGGLIDKTTGLVVCGFEIKFRGGFRRDLPVDLQRFNGDRNYKTQVYLQMLVYDWAENYLVAQSDVNLDFYKYKWDPKWWTGEKKGVGGVRNLLFFRYSMYLAWYWEDHDRTTDLSAANVRAFIKWRRTELACVINKIQKTKAEQKESLGLVDAKVRSEILNRIDADLKENQRLMAGYSEAHVKAMFECRPSNEDIAIIRQWSAKRQKKKCLCESHSAATHTYAYQRGYEIELKERPANVKQWAAEWHDKLCCALRGCVPKKPKSAAGI